MFICVITDVGEQSRGCWAAIPSMFIHFPAHFLPKVNNSYRVSGVKEEKLSFVKKNREKSLFECKFCLPLPLLTL